jgi:hypothetical protein
MTIEKKTTIKKEKRMSGQDEIGRRLKLVHITIRASKILARSMIIVREVSLEEIGPRCFLGRIIV